MSKKKVLIHLHPSTSFLGRCLSLINFDDECFLYNGPSNFSSENKNFLTWFIRNFSKNKKCEKLKIFIYFFKPKLIFNLLKNFFFFKISRKNKSYYKDALLDFILRNNKLANLYYQYASWRIFLRLIFNIYSRYVVSSYFAILEDLKPDLVIVSHAVYINYGGLIIASTEKNININIVEGGFFRSYLVSDKLETYHVVRYLRYLYPKYNSYKKNEIKGEARNSAANEKDIEFRRASRENPCDTLIICSHCFADNNHIGDSNKMLFETYFDWLKSTIQILNNDNNPSYKNYIVKVHPYIEVYGEKFIFDRIINSFTNWQKINLKICNQEQNISDLINTNIIYPLFLTVHGQICHELGTLGLPIVACGNAQGPEVSQYNPESISEYKEILKNNIYATECLSKLKNSEYIKKESISYQVFQNNLKPEGELNNKLWKVRDYYNFNSGSKKIDDKFIKIFSDLKSQKPPQKIMLDNGFGVYIPSKN